MLSSQPKLDATESTQSPIILAYSLKAIQIKLPLMLDPSAIRTMAENLVGSTCHFILDTENNPFTGGEYVIYALENNPKSRRICLRIPRNPTGPYISLLLEREADFRRRIDAARVDLFQPLIAYDHTPDNSLHTPYLALGWADGSPLKWSDTNPAAECDRKHILRAIANASLDLLGIRQAGESALDWITSKIDRKIIRAKANELRGGTVAECEHQKKLIPMYWMRELDNAPHVLVHGDLSGNNIIVNDTFTVQSIIDLGWAEMLPLQFAAVYPRFLTHEPGVDGQGFTRRNTKQMKQDRDFYLECVKARAIQDGGIVMDYYRVLSREDEPSRHWWFTAASRIDIHKAMASCNWAPPIHSLGQ
ncbi:hypothetical protein F5Y12DRAFT_247103 [Xylaria sp. FL1777]|nr:hypothetical protein F5Y12DRAFT_247103 [Xylaria sp. FL1777]